MKATVFVKSHWGAGPSVARRIPGRPSCAAERRQSKLPIQPGDYLSPPATVPARSAPPVLITFRTELVSGGESATNTRCPDRLDHQPDAMA